MENIAFIILIGMGATAVMDVWAVLRKYLFGIAPTNWGLVGRWVGHLTRGKFTHNAIAQSHPIRWESVIGWFTHYLIGIGYAVLLVMLFGSEWLNQPSIAPALLIGIATVVAPLFVLQPAMGAGVAGSRTPKPNSTRLQSLINHVIFGLGLYVSAVAGNFVCSL